MLLIAVPGNLLSRKSIRWILLLILGLFPPPLVNFLFDLLKLGLEVPFSVRELHLGKVLPATHAPQLLAYFCALDSPGLPRIQFFSAALLGWLQLQLYIART